MNLLRLPEHYGCIEHDLIYCRLIHVCMVLTTETSIWRDGHCVLCDLADSGGPLPAHESDCPVLLARRALKAALAEVDE